MRGILFFMIIFSFKTMVWAKNFEQKLKNEIQRKELQESCKLQIKEKLIPFSCYQLESFGQEFLKIKCLQAVKNAKDSEELTLSQPQRSQLDKDCLQLVDERLKDLQYKESKSTQ